MWCIKVILRGFELVSGLKGNFFKSNLFGLNLEDYFLHAASIFLFCCIGSIPLKFLGIPIAANPRRCSTWTPVVNALRKRLSSWSGRHLSTGGRVTLINSVLTNMPLYLSFFKSPKKVAHEIVSIQRNFLWSGNSDAKKTCWIGWDKVCLPKNCGGLYNTLIFK